MRDGILNALFPHFAIGFLEHDIALDDPLRRMRNIGRWFGLAVWGTREEAAKASRTVRNAHKKVRGFDPVTGRNYDATDPDGLLLGHVILWMSLITIRDAYVAPITASQRDRALEEAATVGELIGVPARRIPLTWAECEAYWEARKPEMCVGRSGRRLLRPFTAGSLPEGGFAAALPAPVRLAAPPFVRMAADMALCTMDDDELMMVGLERGPELRSARLVKLYGRAIARVMGTPPVRARIEQQLGDRYQSTLARARHVVVTDARG